MKSNTVIEIDRNYRVLGCVAPAMVLKERQVFDLRVPMEWNEQHTAALVAHLGAAANAPRVVHAREGAVRGTWLMRRRARSVEQRMALIAHLPVLQARELCTRCGVDPGMDADLLPWTDQRLLEAELALLAHPNILIVDDSGFDPTGERRFAAHIRARAAAGRHATVVLRFLVQRGDSGPLTYRTVWGDDSADIRCEAVSDSAHPDQAPPSEPPEEPD